MAEALLSEIKGQICPSDKADHIMNVCVCVCVCVCIDAKMNTQGNNDLLVQNCCNDLHSDQEACY